MFLISVDGYSSGKYVWPLNDKTYTFEVKDSQSSDNTQCGLQFSGAPPEGLSRLPLVLDGTEESFVDIQIGNDNEFKSFSFAVFVNLHSTSGCLFHFKTTGSAGNDLKEFDLCFSGGQVTMSWAFGTGDFETVSTSFSLRGWQLIIVSRDYDKNPYNFQIKMNGNATSETESAQQSGSLGLPGVLRIGAKQDGSSKLLGKVTCIVMYDTHQTVVSEESEIKQDCADQYSLPISGNILVTLTSIFHIVRVTGTFAYKQHSIL